jgi:hypothetical protein
MKNFHKGLDRETWALINQVTKQSDKRVAEAVKELKAKAKPRNK